MNLTRPVSVNNATLQYMQSLASKDGPLEKLWGGEGNFRAAGIFFRYQIPCMNFF